MCYSSSNLPAYGIEGGLASFICIYPDGVPGQSPPATVAATAAATSAKPVTIAIART